MCNSCKAVLHHVNETFTLSHPSNRQWKEWEVQDKVDQICNIKTFDGYGVKLRGGKNVLSGPGIKEEESLQGGEASRCFFQKIFTGD